MMDEVVCVVSQHQNLLTAFDSRYTSNVLAASEVSMLLQDDVRIPDCEFVDLPGIQTSHKSNTTALVSWSAGTWQILQCLVLLMPPIQHWMDNTLAVKWL